MNAVLVRKSDPLIPYAKSTSGSDKMEDSLSELRSDVRPQT